MINLPGNLYIREVKGRNGGFSVGRLVTDIGEFVLRDPFLGQYGEGCYQGEFGIAEIYPASYVAGGRLVVEIRATLASLVLAAVEAPGETDADTAGLTGQQPVAPENGHPTGDPKPESGPVKPDTESPPDGGQADATGDAKNGHPAQGDIFPPAGDPGDGGADALLFGTLWPLGDTVKLDTSVDRPLFRRQKERIKALGYAFQASGQRWVRS
jgi:hypothetical protein